MNEVFFIRVVTACVRDAVFLGEPFDCMRW